jgi:hypothetical protein
MADVPVEVRNEYVRYANLFGLYFEGYRRVLSASEVKIALIS